MPQLDLSPKRSRIVTGGSGTYGVFVSCLPGRLGYFQGEELGARYILERPF